MALILKLISPSELIDGQVTEQEFNELGGTIGRKPGNDLVLLDPERYISGRHALIEYRDGHYYITDTSTNGVYINDARAPLGQGNTTEIMSGDKITIGTYQFLSYISDNMQNKSPEMPLDVPQQPSSMPVTEENPIDSLLSNAADVDDAHATDYSAVDPLALLGVNENQHTPADSASPSFPDNNFEHAIPDNTDLFGETEPLPEFSDSNENIDDIFNLINDDSNKTSAPVERQQPVTIDEQFTPPSNFIPEDWDLMEGQAEKPSESVAEATPAKTSQAELDPLQLLNETPQDSSAKPDSFTAKEPPVAPPPESQAHAEKPTESHYREQPPLKKVTASNGTPPASAPATSTDLHALLDAFFEGCQINPDLLNYNNDVELMRKIGQLTRIATNGLMQALLARSSIKSGFRVNKTTIAPVENNPLKFSVTNDEALNILLSDDRKGYMSATQAFNEGFSDLQTHQMALMAGLQATISTIFSQFNPEQLERSFETQGGSSFIPVQKKSRNWEQYIDYYNRLSERLQDDFQNIYGEEFAKAYEEQVMKLKFSQKND